MKSKRDKSYRIRWFFLKKMSLYEFVVVFTSVDSFWSVYNFRGDGGKKALWLLCGKIQ